MSEVPRDTAERERQVVHSHPMHDRENEKLRLGRCGVLQDQLRFVRSVQVQIRVRICREYRVETSEHWFVKKRKVEDG